MKAFWAFIALLLAATAAVLLMKPNGRSGGAPGAVPRDTPAAVPTPTFDVGEGSGAQVPPAEPAPPVPSVAPWAAAEAPAQPPAATPASLPSEAAIQAPSPPASEAPAEAPTPSPAQAPAAPEVAETKPAPEAPTPTPGPEATGTPAEATVPAPQPAEATAPTGTPAPAWGEAPALNIVRREDGSLLINDRWVIKGDGSAEKPYEVTWEYLISAGETYDPKAGKNQIPPHIQMLDARHVRITGWIAFPLYVQSTSELLVMLNQWDGCCIGVPPTPYDAVEVRLKAPAEGDARLATFGTVQGIMGVKPYVVGGWLVGLYVMDQARIIPGRFNDGGS